jgi:hypothetical protein
MADNDPLLDKIGILIDQKLEPVKKTLQVCNMDKANEHKGKHKPIQL